MALYKYLRPATPSGPLSTNVPPATVKEIVKQVREVQNSTESKEKVAIRAIASKVTEAAHCEENRCQLGYHTRTRACVVKCVAVDDHAHFNA